MHPRYRVTIQNPQFESCVIVWDTISRREVAKFPYREKDAAGQSRAKLAATAEASRLQSIHDGLKSGAPMPGMTVRR